MGRRLCPGKDIWPGCVLGILLMALPASAGGVAVVGTVLSDNGDDDGFADTQETVTLRLVIRNTTGVDLTDVTASLTTEDGAIACLTQSTISIGALAAGEERTTDDAFVFVVLPDVERTSVAEDLSAHFGLSISSANVLDLATTPGIDLDLDLDVSGGSGPTVYFESFEDGFGTFTTMHLDEDLNPPESDLSNWPAGVLGSDGFRCQYADPEWEIGIVIGPNLEDEHCFPNASDAPDAFYFNIVTDRAFSGAQSMGFNIFVDPASGYTTPIGQLEAVRTIDPVNLAWDRVCSTSRDSFCNDGLDCPTGETCVRSASKLSLKHQVSFVDYRSVGIDPNRSADRSVIAVQLAGDDGVPGGDWLKVHPYVNVYDSQANSNFFLCTFDPTDDGNDEGDFFDPTDPKRLQGPSSTCAPGFSFANQGNTDEPYSPENVGDGEPGGGLEGSAGPGTWVEPVVDLSRFQGRRIRIRLLQTGVKVRREVTWHGLFSELGPGDDGWFIDDITVTDALSEPATVLVDTKDNSALPLELEEDVETDGVFDICDNCPAMNNSDQADEDHDGLGNACDCDSGFAGTPETNDGFDNQCPGDDGFGLVDELEGLVGFTDPADPDRFSWTEQPGATEYAVVRAGDPGFTIDCACTRTYENSVLLTEEPAPGTAYFYLPRSFAPNLGSPGADSLGNERSGPCFTTACPGGS